jgi:hypothetical protein
MLRNNLLGVWMLPVLLLIFPPSDSCNHSKMKSNSNSANQSVSNTSTQDKSKQLSGQWGGQGVSMEIEGTKATLTFDCAHGTISEAIVPDEAGKFTVKGSFTRERGGPMREDDVSTGAAATYSGVVQADSLSLTITLNGSKEPVASYALTHGKAGRIRRCM